ncbi:MAG: hypothetical protein ABH969_10420 [Pseudomonadota bacterium]
MALEKFKGLTNRKNLLTGMVLAFLTAGITGCATLEPIEGREKKNRKTVAVILRSFASQQIRPGDPWKIYLNASHAHGEMKNIVCTIDQPGMASYPASFTRIKGENRKELSGYIYLNTMSPDNLNFVNISLTVQIQDHAGHYSQPTVFPLSFDLTFRQEPPPPKIFQEKDLGPIMINLRTPGEGESRDIFKRFPFRQ